MAKALRWLGPGVFHLKRADGRVAVIPAFDHEAGVNNACIIKDAANIAAIGEARIAQLVKDHFMEWIPWTEEVASVLRSDAKPFDAATGEGSLAIADANQGQEVAQISATESTALWDTFKQKQAQQLASDAASSGRTSVAPAGAQGSAQSTGAGPK